MTPAEYKELIKKDTIKIGEDLEMTDSVTELFNELVDDGNDADDLQAFIDEYGMPPLSEVGSQTNIDMLLSILTTKASDLKGKNIGFNIQQAYHQGVVSEKAVLNGFVSSLPVVDVKDRFGIGSGSEIMDQKGGLNQVILGKEEVDKLRDAALILEQTNLRLALKFMELALSMRPNGPVLKKKVKEYRTALNLDISDD